MNFPIIMKGTPCPVFGRWKVEESHKATHEEFSFPAGISRLLASCPCYLLPQKEFPGENYISLAIECSPIRGICLHWVFIITALLHQCSMCPFARIRSFLI